MLWLALRFPALAVELASRGMQRPEQPFVLLEGNRVAQCNEAARRAGIRAGMTLATAQSIVRDVEHGQRDVDTERKRLRYLAETAYRFTANASTTGADALLLEIHGSLKLFGGSHALKRQAMQAFRKLGHEVLTGFGHTPLAALALARAELALSLPRDAGPKTVRRQTLKILGEVHLAHTECSAEIVERFDNMGIRHLHEVLRLPPAELGRRFGSELLDYLGRLTGRKADPRAPLEPADRFDASVHLLESVSDQSALLFPMQRLTGELAAWLLARQSATPAIRWRFTTLGGESDAFDVRFARPQSNRQAFLDMSRLKLTASTLPAEIMSIRLSARRLTPLTPAHRDLFAGSHPALAPTDLVDRYRARLGFDGCSGITRVDDHRPELAWRRALPGNTRPSRRALERPFESARPFWLLEAPRPVRRSEIALLRGPERIDGGWWGLEVRRDYYVARHESGAHCWVFAELGDSRWFIHGYFA